MILEQEYTIRSLKKMTNRSKITNLIIWALLIAAFCYACVVELHLNEKARIRMGKRRIDTVYVEKDTVFIDSLNIKK